MSHTAVDRDGTSSTGRPIYVGPVGQICGTFEWKWTCVTVIATWAKAAVPLSCTDVQSNNTTYDSSVLAREILFKLIRSCGVF